MPNILMLTPLRQGPYTVNPNETFELFAQEELGESGKK